MEWTGCGRLEKFQRNFVYRIWALMVLVRPVLHRLSTSNETVRNSPKHEFWVQWIGSDLFVVKNSDATSFTELVR
jgi:hypothetical protein